MSVKRTDSRGRILQTGESQRKDGRYVYKYLDRHGETKFIYSWRLNATDPLPKGKRDCQPLRELEKDILRDAMDGIDSVNKKMTLCQLYDKQNKLKPDVRKSSEYGRQRLMRLLQEDRIGNMHIDMIKPSDAKEWAIRMKKKGHSYQSINNYKRSLKAAFYTAVNDDLVRKNPFNWNMADVLEDDTEHKTALTKEQTDALLAFAKIDYVYRRYYNAVVVLLNTGMRISELCGLTDRDIDFENGFINIDHQMYKDSEGYHVVPPKTESSVRKIPMVAPVREALQDEMSGRKNKKKTVIDGYTGFIFLNHEDYPMHANLYGKAFRGMIKKHNKIYRGYELPSITPHTLRHTFCTNMANLKMSPANLQFVMGHKNITMTLGYYTHASSESALAEMVSLTT